MSLVERLREAKETTDAGYPYYDVPETIEEAADRIELLEGIVRELIPLTSALLGAVNDPVAMPLYIALDKARDALSHD